MEENACLGLGWVSPARVVCTVPRLQACARSALLRGFALSPGVHTHREGMCPNQPHQPHQPHNTNNTTPPPTTTTPTRTTTRIPTRIPTKNTNKNKHKNKHKNCKNNNKSKNSKHSKNSKNSMNSMNSKNTKNTKNTKTRPFPSRVPIFFCVALQTTFSGRHDECRNASREPLSGGESDDSAQD